MGGGGKAKPPTISDTSESGSVFFWGSIVLFFFKGNLRNRKETMLGVHVPLEAWGQHEFRGTPHAAYALPPGFGWDDSPPTYTGPSQNRGGPFWTERQPSTLRGPLF